MTKERLQFDFAPDALARLDAIKEQSGVSTRAEVIRSALRVYEWMIDALDREDTVTVTDAEGNMKTTFPHAPHPVRLL